MLFLYFILSPISGLPILLNEQKKAFIFTLFGYILTVIALFIGVWLKLKFVHTLWIYSVTFTLIYLSILIWYFLMVRKRNESLN
jgi:O-antigen/teichoic acid export membrane protein